MNITSVSGCADCGACANICPAGAITVSENELFYRPEADTNKCVDCGKCLDVCPVRNQPEAVTVKGAYSVVSKDKALIKSSSSGGAMSALAENILQGGGVVFGAVYDKPRKKVIIGSTDEYPLDELRRSKYVESLAGASFAKIKSELESGRSVMFCGTPCQAAGLRRYLNRPYDKLLICDFVCGGLPSHKIYREYIESLEKRYGSVVTEVNFRPKTFGWRRYAVRISFANGKEYNRIAELDPYLSAFLHKKCSVRDNCLSCPFAEKHLSDITLADFWQSDKLTGIADDDTGISLLLTNTEAGEKAAASLDGVNKTKVDIDKAGYVLKPVSPSQSSLAVRESFLSEYKRSGIIKAGKKYCEVKGTDALKARAKEYLIKK